MRGKVIFKGMLTLILIFNAQSFCKGIFEIRYPIGVESVGRGVLLDTENLLCVLVNGNCSNITCIDTLGNRVWSVDSCLPMYHIRFVDGVLVSIEAKSGYGRKVIFSKEQINDGKIIERKIFDRFAVCDAAVINKDKALLENCKGDSFALERVSMFDTLTSPRILLSEKNEYSMFKCIDETKSIVRGVFMSRDSGTFYIEFSAISPLKKKLTFINQHTFRDSFFFKKGLLYWLRTIIGNGEKHLDLLSLPVSLKYIGKPKKIDELPYGWGLLDVRGKRALFINNIEKKIRIIGIP